MNPTQLQLYWSFLHQVIEYAVDEDEEKSLQYDKQTVGVLSPQVFLNELYVPWVDDLFEEDLIPAATFGRVSLERNSGSALGPEHEGRESR